MMDLPDPNKADAILDLASKTYRERHAVYGDNYKVVGEVMKALFPDGIDLKTVDDHNRFHLFMLQIVKITRYANNFEAGGHEDSQLDISVYAAMLVEVDREVRGRGIPPEPEVDVLWDGLVGAHRGVG